MYVCMYVHDLIIFNEEESFTDLRALARPLYLSHLQLLHLPKLLRYEEYCIPHTSVILVKRGRLREISDVPLLLLLG
jgi:hypothetical protein